MNGQWWSVIGVVVSCLGGYLTARLSVKATNRKTDAEARAVEVATQQRLIKGWDAELSRRDTKITKQEVQIGKLETRLETIDSALDSAHEQNDLLAEELAEERKKNGLLRASLDVALAELDNAREQVKILIEQLANSKQQVRVLVEHAKRVDDWWQVHWSTNGHTNDKDKPPTLTPFDVTEEDT